MNYYELRQKHQKEVNELPLGFAYSNKQFDEMMEKFGLEKDNLQAICTIGSGCYIKKSDYDLVMNTFKRHKQEHQQEIDNDKTGNGYVYQMFRDELADHEYCITYSLDETLDALNLTMEEIEKHKNLKHGLQKALKRY